MDSASGNEKPQMNSTDSAAAEDILTVQDSPPSIDENVASASPVAVADDLDAEASAEEQDSLRSQEGGPSETGSDDTLSEYSDTEGDDTLLAGNDNQETDDESFETGEDGDVNLQDEVNNDEEQIDPLTKTESVDEEEGDGISMDRRNEDSFSEVEPSTGVDADASGISPHKISLPIDTDPSSTRDDIEVVNINP